MGTPSNNNSKHSYPLSFTTLFSWIPQSVASEFEKKLVVARYGTGSIIHREGTVAEGLGFVLEGRVKLSALAMGTKIALLNIAGAGDVLGLAAVVSGKSHLSTAQATIPSVVGLLRHRDFAVALQKYPELSNAVALRLANQCKEYGQDMLVLRVACSGSQRLAAALLRLGDRYRNGSARQLALTYTHSELGQLIGASRETVTRQMRRFEAQGVIRMKRSAFYVADARALKQIAEAG